MKTRITYAERLKDPRWQKKRLEILNRDNFQCRRCHSKENTLHVHHAFYDKGKMPWDYDSRYLVSLCEACHEKTEEERREILGAMASPRIQAIILELIRWETGPLGAHVFFGWAVESMVQASQRRRSLVDGAVPEENLEMVCDEVTQACREAVESIFRFQFEPIPREAPETA